MGQDINRIGNNENRRSIGKFATFQGVKNAFEQPYVSVDQIKPCLIWLTSKTSGNDHTVASVNDLILV